MLEELDLQENSINDLKFEVIIPALEDLTSLKSLNLSKNTISNLSFSTFITKVTWLNHLNLAGCILRDEGFQTLLSNIGGISRLNCNANRFTVFSKNNLIAFVKSHKLRVHMEMRKQDMHFKEIKKFEKEIREGMENDC